MVKGSASQASTLVPRGGGSSTNAPPTAAGLRKRSSKKSLCIGLHHMQVWIFTHFPREINATTVLFKIKQWKAQREIRIDQEVRKLPSTFNAQQKSSFGMLQQCTNEPKYLTWIGLTHVSEALRMPGLSELHAPSCPEPRWCLCHVVKLGTIDTLLVPSQRKHNYTCIVRFYIWSFYLDHHIVGYFNGSKIWSWRNIIRSSTRTATSIDHIAYNKCNIIFI